MEKRKVYAPTQYTRYINAKKLIKFRKGIQDWLLDDNRASNSVRTQMRLWSGAHGSYASKDLTPPNRNSRTRNLQHLTDNPTTPFAPKMIDPLVLSSSQPFIAQGGPVASSRDDISLLLEISHDSLQFHPSHPIIPLSFRGP